MFPQIENSMLNPELNIADLGSLYKEDQRVRIDDFLDSGFSRVVVECADNLNYDYIKLL